MRLRTFRLTAVVALVLAAGSAVTHDDARAWVPGTNGNIVYASSEGLPTSGIWSGTPHIWVIRSDATNKHQLTFGNDAWPSWSPDGNKIVFSRQYDYSTTGDADTLVWRIYEMNADGTNQHPLTAGELSGTNPNRGDNMPRFSSDGTKIAFIRTSPNPDSSRPPDAQIWVMNADGSGPHAITDLAPTHIYAVGWEPGDFGPDHQHIVFLADRLDGSCSGVGSWLSCRTFYEINAEGGAPVALSIEPGHPDAASGGFGAWDSFDDSPAGLVWGDATSVISPTGLLRDDVPNDYKVFEATPGATAWSQTPLIGDHPSFAPDANTTGRLAYVGCVGNRDRVLNHCNYQLSVGFLGGGGGIQQLTFDASNHYSPSWGPTPTTTPLQLQPRPVSLGLPPQLGTPSIPVIVHCPMGAGHPCTSKIRIMNGTSGRKGGSMTFQSKAGAPKTVYLPLPSWARAGMLLTFQLTTTVAGHSSTAKVTSPVLQPASLNAACPQPPFQVGSHIKLTGALKDGAPAGKRLVIVATSPDGRSLVAHSTTGAGGSYSAALVPDWGGLWELQAIWPGDAKHPLTASRSCAVMVETPPPAGTDLGIACPSGAGLKAPLEITGSLAPAFSGAQITLEYKHPREGLPTEKITTAVTTSAKGEYLDKSVAPDDPGEWDVTAYYDGDAANDPSTSKSCAIAVS